jgi:hypothetical protein
MKVKRMDEDRNARSERHSKTCVCEECFPKKLKPRKTPVPRKHPDGCQCQDCFEQMMKLVNEILRV